MARKVPINNVVANEHTKMLEWIKYDPETGIFEWLKQPRGRRTTGPAGTRRADGYLTIAVFGQRRLGHRLAWFIVHGHWPAGYVDHINGDPSDNRLCNLRECTHQQNRMNTKRPSSNTSGEKGVSRYKGGRWTAQLHKHGKHIHLGVFDTFQEAVEARRAGAKAIFADFYREN